MITRSITCLLRNLFLASTITRRWIPWFSTTFAHIVGKHECHAAPPRALASARQRKTTDVTQLYCVVGRLGLAKSCVLLTSDRRSRLSTLIPTEMRPGKTPLRTMRRSNLRLYLRLRNAHVQEERVTEGVSLFELQVRGHCTARRWLTVDCGCPARNQTRQEGNPPKIPLLPPSLNLSLTKCASVCHSYDRNAMARNRNARHAKSPQTIWSVPTNLGGSEKRNLKFLNKSLPPLRRPVFRPVLDAHRQAGALVVEATKLSASEPRNPPSPSTLFPTPVGVSMMEPSTPDPHRKNPSRTPWLSPPRIAGRCYNLNRSLDRKWCTLPPRGHSSNRLGFSIRLCRCTRLVLTRNRLRCRVFRLRIGRCSCKLFPSPWRSEMMLMIDANPAE